MLSDMKTVCYCSNVTAGTIRHALREGAGSIEEIRSITGACTVGQCKERSPLGRCCRQEIEQLIGEMKN